MRKVLTEKTSQFYVFKKHKTVIKDFEIYNGICFSFHKLDHIQHRISVWTTLEFLDKKFNYNLNVKNFRDKVFYMKMEEKVTLISLFEFDYFSIQKNAKQDIERYKYYLYKKYNEILTKSNNENFFGILLRERINISKYQEEENLNY